MGIIKRLSRFFLPDSTDTHLIRSVKDIYLDGHNTGIYDEAHLKMSGGVDLHAAGNGDFDISLGVNDSFVAQNTIVGMGFDDKGLRAGSINYHRMPSPKVLPIGTWNMNTAATKDVAHGLTLANIVHFSAVLFNDDQDSMYPHDFNPGTTSCSIAANSTNIRLTVTAGFASADWDGTSTNRGYITIWYMSSDERGDLP